MIGAVAWKFRTPAAATGRATSPRGRSCFAAASAVWSIKVGSSWAPRPGRRPSKSTSPVRPSFRRGRSTCSQGSRIGAHRCARRRRRTSAKCEHDHTETPNQQRRPIRAAQARVVAAPEACIHRSTEGRIPPASLQVPGRAQPETPCRQDTSQGRKYRTGGPIRDSVSITRRGV